MTTTTELKDDKLFTYIPHTLRGRDFDQNLMSYTFPYFEFQETVPFKLFCGCMEFSKCQHLVIHKPISFRLMNKLLDIKHRNNGFHIRFCRPHVGNTSSTFVCELIYNNVTYITLTILHVHIDPIKRRSKRVCKKLIKFKQDILDKINDSQFKNMIMNRRNEMNESVNILSNYMKRNNNGVVFSMNYTLSITDHDFNRHINQGYYSRLVENCLYEYHNAFYRAKYRIKEFSQIFVNEMKAERNKSSNCIVKILAHNKLNNNKNEEIIGYIEQSGTKRCEFRLVLIPNTKKAKL